MATSRPVCELQAGTWKLTAVVVIVIGLGVRPIAAQVCVGDCTGSGIVTITDLVLGVDIALGLQPVSACSAFENAVGEVDIAQLIISVDNALYGCGQKPPNTGTPTATTLSDTPTPTPPVNTPTVTAESMTPGEHFIDNGDGTITDHWTGLIWEKKIALHSGINMAKLHDADNTYVSAGRCSLATDILCQPNPAAAAACAEWASGKSVSCAECKSMQGTCEVDPTRGALTTIWDWVAHLNTGHFAGHADWRVPTVSELESILDYAAMQPATTIEFSGAQCGSGCTNAEKPACSCTQAAIYWSSTDAWVVDFDLGNVGTYDKPAYAYVRAVRGNSTPPFPRYIDNGNGTITDKQTGLMWEKLDAVLNSVHDSYSLDSLDHVLTQKIAKLNDASFAGYNDWRLPTVNELESIVDYTKPTTIDDIFNSNCAISCTLMTCSCTNVYRSYWAATSVSGNASFAWTVNYGLVGGYVNSESKLAMLQARAVRGGL